jgi:hypothetical protein
MSAGDPQILSFKSSQFPESTRRWKHFANQFFIHVEMEAIWEPINSVNVKVGRKIRFLN